MGHFVYTCINIWRNLIIYYVFAMTRNRNSRWRSCKPEVPIFQFVEELETRFQVIIPFFRGRAILWRHFQHCHTTPEVGIQDGKCCVVGETEDWGLLISLPVMHHCQWYVCFWLPRGTKLPTRVVFEVRSSSASLRSVKKLSTVILRPHWVAQGL